MARPPRNGDFYINNANQDFWLRENGAWVRKGNIRDEGTSGLVGVQPILNLGFAQSSAVQRIRLLAPGAQAMGFDTTAAVDRIRQLSASMTLGYGMLSSLDRLRAVAAAIDVGMGMDMGIADPLDTIPSSVINLAAAMGFGFIVSPVVVGRERDLVAPMNFGSDVSAVLVLRVRQLTASMALGVDETAAIQQIKAVAASMAMGYDETAALQRIRALTSSIAMGYDEAAAVTRSRQLTDSVAMGFSQASSIQQIKAVAASLAMGYSEAAAVTRIRQLTDSVAMGFAQSSTVSLTAPSGNVVIGLNAAPWSLWYDSNINLLTTTWTVPTSAVQFAEYNATTKVLVLATLSGLFRYDMSGATPAYLGALSSPPAWAHISSIAFSANGTRFAVMDSGLSPFAWVYDTSTWTTVTAPSSITASLGLSFDGTANAHIVEITGLNTIKLFDTPGMAASATQPGTVPNSLLVNIDFSFDGAYFAVNGNGSPENMKVWRMSALSAPLADPATMPHTNSQQNGKALRWHPSLLKFALCDVFGTSIYTVSGTTITLDQQLNYNVIGGVSPAWRADGLKLFVSNAGAAPRFQVWSRSGTTYTQDTAPTSQPATNPLCIATTL